MYDAEIAGMKPAAGKCRLARRFVLQITLHHHITAEHHLAQSLAIARHRFHGLRIDNIERFQHRIGDALARFLGGLVGRVQRLPFTMPIIDGGRPIGFGQAVKMRDVEAGRLHRRQNGFRRRRRGGGELHDMRQRLFLLRRRVEERRHHDRRAA